jgi:VWFA-related protein
MQKPRKSSRLRASRFLCLSAICTAGVLGAQQQPPPRFRSAVDVVAVDVQVVDGSGKPIPALAADKFEVSIGGKRRRVLSAEFIEDGPAAQNSAPSGDPTRPRTNDRMFFLAIDESSFAAGDTRGIVVAAQKFVELLAPSDYVGMVSFPSGVQINPTQLHRTVIQALDKVSGRRSLPPVRFKLRPSEILAISAKTNGCTNAVAYNVSTSGCDEDVEPTFARACGAELQCRKLLIDEVKAVADELQDNARKSFTTLGNVMRAVAPVPVRKIMVVVTAGMLLSGQAGVAPDAGTLPMMVGHEAARANATVYTLFVDRGFIQQYAADARNSPASNTNLGLDGAIMEQSLVQFTGTVGGGFIRAVTGDPELAFRRVMTETSAHYLLGVEPEEADRDGRPRQLSVKANTGQRGTTVRARSWVVMK